MACSITGQFSNKNEFSECGLDFLDAEKTGTTIMAVEYDGGVIVGADSRTTTGSYIANRVTDKLTKVTDNIFCCRSGSAADTQAISNVVAYHLSVHKMEFEGPPRVRTAAKLFQDLCYRYRDQMSAGIICAGWDEVEGGQVYSIPLGGMCTRQAFTIGGSGSTYIYGYVDATYKDKMSSEQCIKFTTNAVSLAIGRDGSSGGIVRLADINKEGVTRKTVLPNELPKFSEL